MIPLESHVEQLFRQARRPQGELCENPVTGQMWVSGVDKVGPQKRRALQALRAREWFAINGPSYLPPLPLTHGEREALHVSPLLYVYSKFARSVASLGFAIDQHPSFEDYARGVM